MQKRSLIFLILLLVGYLLPIKAYGETPYAQVIEQVNQLLTAKNYPEAYAYADQYTFDYGGEAEFDLLLGFAAYGDQKYQEAVFAFERVVLNQPSSYLGRLFLAKSYRKVNNLAAAITELEALQVSRLSEQQSETVEDMLNGINRQLINRKKSWYNIIALDVAYDSNINSGTDEDSIAIPGFEQPITLFESAKKTEDSSYHVSYALGYQHPLNQNQSLKVDLAAHHYGYSEFNQFQRQQASLSLAFEQEFSNARLLFSGFTRPLWLEQEVKSDTVEDLTTPVKREIALYRIESGLGLSFSHNVGKRFSYNMGLNYSVLDNDVSPELNATRSKVRLGIQYRSGLIHGLSIHWQQDVSDDDEYEYNSKDVAGISYQLGWPITNALINQSVLSFEQHDYQAPHPIFQEVREETLVSFSNLIYYIFTEKQQLKFSLNVQAKDSDLPLFKYDRAEVGLGWQYRF